jgi:hypothetical protein
MRWAGHVAYIGEMRYMYSVFDGKPEGKIPLERPRDRWKNNIKWVQIGFIWLRIETGGGLL